jgi:hypothetical protein
LNFEKDQPYQYEEERNLPAVRQRLTKQALEYAELADTKNYRAFRTEENSDQIAIVHVSPTASTPQHAAKIEKATPRRAARQREAAANKLQASGFPSLQRSSCLSTWLAALVRISGISCCQTEWLIASH